MLKRCIRVKNAKTNAGKRNPSYNIVNTIKGNNPKAPKRPNKGRKHNGNTSKDKKTGFTG